MGFYYFVRQVFLGSSGEVVGIVLLFSFLLGFDSRDALLFDFGIGQIFGVVEEHKFVEEAFLDNFVRIRDLESNVVLDSESLMSSRLVNQ
jgi:hypothetical protein